MAIIIERMCSLCGNIIKIKIASNGDILSPHGYWDLDKFEYWECNECLKYDKEMLKQSGALETRKYKYKERVNG